MAAHLLRRDAGGGAEFAEIDAEILIEGAHALHRAVDVDWVMMPARSDFADQALGFAQRIGADEDAAVGVGVKCGQKAIDFAAGIGMAEDGEAEGRFGDEDVAGDWLERLAGGVGTALIVTGDDDALPCMFEQDLRGAEDVAGGDVGYIDAAHADLLAIADGGAAGRSVAQGHDGEGFLGRPDMAVAAARVVGVTVGDERAFGWL